MSFKIFILAFSVILNISPLTAQGPKESVTSKYANGIYSSFQSFKDATPTTTMKVVRKPLNKKMKKKKMYDSCYFDYAVNDQRITNAFAIVFEGDFYFNSGHLAASQSNNLRLGPINSYYKVVEYGKYLYLLGKVEPDNTASTIGGGLGGFAGSLIGSAIDAGTQNYKRGPIGIAYNVTDAKIFVLSECAYLKKVALSEKIDINYDCLQSSKIKPEEVHHLVKLINKQNK